MAIELNVVENEPIGLSLDADTGISLSVGETTIVSTSDYEELRNKPSIGGVELVGDTSIDALGGYTQSQVDTKLSSKADASDIPSLDGYATESWVENKHYLTEHQSLAEYYTKGQTDGLLNGKANTSDVPNKTSQLTNDSGFLTSYTETDPTVPAWAKAPNKPSYTASEVGALPSDTTIPSKTSDLTNDSGYITGMEILSYGSSTWQNFIDAYTAQKVVYCRASSNSNPASGSQTRLAFMAYVNNAESPTEVEFQYYRSVSSHSASQQGDQVFIYKLAKTGGWTVTTREAMSKIATGTGLTSSYANGTITLSLNATIPSKVSDLTNDSGFLTLADLPIYNGGVV